MKQISCLKIIKIIATVFCACVMMFASAQTSPKLSGAVVNAMGEPVTGATVTNLTAGKATLTNEEGKFSLAAAKGSRLEITAVGYKVFAITLTDAAPLRRWKTAEVGMNSPAYDVSGATRQVRAFQANRDYLWPVPSVQRQENPNLTQNPNYLN